MNWLARALNSVLIWYSGSAAADAPIGPSKYETMLPPIALSAFLEEERRRLQAFNYSEDRLASLLGLEAMPSELVFIDNTPVTRCDELAGHPADNNLPPDLSLHPYYLLIEDQAFEECTQAVKQYPQSARLTYNLFRAAAAKRDPALKLETYRDALATGYVRAFIEFERPIFDQQDTISLSLSHFLVDKGWFEIAIISGNFYLNTRVLDKAQFFVEAGLKKESVASIAQAIRFYRYPGSKFRNSEKVAALQDRARTLGIEDTVTAFIDKNMQENERTAQAIYSVLGLLDSESLPGKANDNTPVTECDLKAAEPFDEENAAGVKGIAFSDLDPASIAICEAALRRYPDSPRHQYLMARMYLRDGRGQEAYALLKSSAKQGFRTSIAALGAALQQHSINAPGYHKKYMDFYRVASVLGDYHGGYWLGYEHNQDENYSVALPLLKSAAASGNSEAMGELGVAYEFIEGEQQSDQKALYWYRKGAIVKDPYSAYRLALMYANGYGTEIDTGRAAQWYLLSYWMAPNSCFIFDDPEAYASEILQMQQHLSKAGFDVAVDGQLTGPFLTALEQWVTEGHAERLFDDLSEFETKSLKQTS